MTFDAAFTAAATEAKAVTVEGPVRTWLQRVCLERRDRWKPSAEERVKAVEALRVYCEGQHSMGLPFAHCEAVHVANKAVGFGPLTVLWVAVMVAQLLVSLRKLLQTPEGQG